MCLPSYGRGRPGSAVTRRVDPRRALVAPPDGATCSASTRGPGLPLAKEMGASSNDRRARQRDSRCSSLKRESTVASLGHRTRPWLRSCADPRLATGCDPERPGALDLAPADSLGDLRWRAGRCRRNAPQSDGHCAAALQRKSRRPSLEASATPAPANPLSVPGSARPRRRHRRSCATSPAVPA